MQFVKRFTIASLVGLVIASASIIYQGRAQLYPPAGAQLVSLVDNFPVNGVTSAVGVQSCVASCTNVILLGPIDTTGYQSIGIQVVSLPPGATLAFQQSADPNCATATNWVIAFGQNTGGVGAFSSFNSSFPETQWQVPATLHCFRMQITAYTAGGVSMEATLRTYPIQYGTGFTQVATSLISASGQGGNYITAAATGTTGAVTATLASVGGKTTFICGFDVSFIGGTANVGPITVTGLVGGNTFTYQATASATGQTLAREYAPCIASNGSTISVTTTADGTATAVDVNVHGTQI